MSAAKQNWPVFAIRPQPGFSATLAAGEEAGLSIAGAPLFEVQPLPWDAPDPEVIDGLLLGSANALRHGGDNLALYRDKPAHVVGAATGDAARAAGLTVANVGEGGLQLVLDGLAGSGVTLLRLAGAEHVALHVPQGVSIVTRCVYGTVPLPMSRQLASALREGGVVLLHSAAAARYFCAECDRIGVDRQKISLAALGPRILAAAGEGWREARAAPVPRESDLLALVDDMCH